MPKETRKMVIGIDLGGENNRTTGICFLREGKRKLLIRTKLVVGKNLLKTIRPYLSKTSVISIDAPLTMGPGKGKMRLFEKYLSQKRFAKHKLKPVPPALVPKLVLFAQSVALSLSKDGFILEKNLIETYPSFIKQAIKRTPKIVFKSKDEEDAFYCAYVAYLHHKEKSFWIGYEDGKLFLPQPTYWRTSWWNFFTRSWEKKHPFKYKFLSTNLAERQKT